MDNQFAIGVPVFNEEQNIGHLVEALLAEKSAARIIAVDDQSTDRSPEILTSAAASCDRLTVIRQEQRGGQLAAWVCAALETDADVVVFIDADAIPAPGAIPALANVLRSDAKVAIASGRVMPARASALPGSARFRSAALHEVRALGFVKEAVIGRFFAVRRSWFLEAAIRTDIIANDTYFSCLASRSGLRSQYVPSAVCYYTEAETLHDFAAQRQRADAGYRQLRALKILHAEDEPHLVRYAAALLRVSLADPAGAIAWVSSQLRARYVKAYRPGRTAGVWETQASTKRSIRG